MAQPSSVYKSQTDDAEDEYDYDYVALPLSVDVSVEVSGHPMVHVNPQAIARSPRPSPLAESLLSNQEKELGLRLLQPEEDPAKKKKDEVQVGVRQNLFTKDNIAIPLSYMCVGFLLTFPNAVIQFYPRTLHASDSQLSTIATLLYGFLSDAFPVRGYHRKPYMFLGYSICALGSLLLCIIETPSVVTFTFLLLLEVFGLIMADVMADALMASKAKLETGTRTGSVQSTVYLSRFMFEIVGYWLGAILYNKADWGWGLDLSEIFLIMTIVPLVVMIPSTYFLHEPPQVCSPIRTQLQTIFDLLSNRGVWQPLSYIFFYSSTMTYNAAWGNFLQVKYRFSAFQYASMGAVGSMVMFVGVWLYKKYGLHRDVWRGVYFWTTFTASFVAVLNILLVFDINETLGISPYWFSLGDSVIITFVAGIQYLPSSLMFVQLCPDGQEGLAYALLTGFQNLAGGVSATISNVLLGVWPVQLEDLEEGNYDGVWKLTILANAINLLPLPFIFLLPSGKAALAKLRAQPLNRCAGVAMIATMVIASIWTVTLSILAMTNPCYEIVGGPGCNKQSVQTSLQLFVSLISRGNPLDKDL